MRGWNQIMHGLLWHYTVTSIYVMALMRKLHETRDCIYFISEFIPNVSNIEAQNILSQRSMESHAEEFTRYPEG